MSVGIAPTKTLAKLANRIAKKCGRGVFEMRDEAIQEDVLEQTAAGDIWGIGSRSAKKLKEFCNIETALDLKYLDRRCARRLLTVVGARLVEELNGISCLPLELAAPLKRSVCCSRSFGTPVGDFKTIQEALASYLNNAGYKMRKQNLSANAVIVFLTTNRFRQNDRQYSNSITLPLGCPTNSTRELRRAAQTALEAIFLKGFQYKKVGVILQGLEPERAITKRLFGESDHIRDKRLMQALDVIKEKCGAGKIDFGMTGGRATWMTKAERKSNRYTTCLREILQVL